MLPAHLDTGNTRRLWYSWSRVLGVQHPVARVTAVLAAGFVLAIMIGPAASNPPTPNETRAAYAAKVERLEAELRLLKNALRACEQRGPKSSATPASLPQHRAQRVPQPFTSQSPNCSPPFQLSSDGIKTYKPGCVDSNQHCEPPFRYVEGIKVFKDGCL